MHRRGLHERRPHMRGQLRRRRPCCVREGEVVVPTLNDDPDAGGGE